MDKTISSDKTQNNNNIPDDAFSEFQSIITQDKIF